MSSTAKNFLAFIEGEVEVTAIPVIMGALAILKANPTVAGVLAAKAYFLGNAPAALLTGETSLIQTGFADISTFLTGLQASGAAAVAAGAAVATAK